MTRSGNHSRKRIQTHQIKLERTWKGNIIELLTKGREENQDPDLKIPKLEGASMSKQKLTDTLKVAGEIPTRLWMETRALVAVPKHPHGVNEFTQLELGATNRTLST